MGYFRLLEHTADIGIEAAGETTADLFTAAAEGLRAVLSDLQKEPCKYWQEVTVAGRDFEELLVNWLNAILFHREVDGLFPEQFRIETITATCLRARIGGNLLADSPRPSREVKAATWHRLEVINQPGGWRARIYLDL
ncbi:archease [Desulfuromonas carbonis]